MVIYHGKLLQYFYNIGPWNHKRNLKSLRGTNTLAYFIELPLDFVYVLSRMLRAAETTYVQLNPCKTCKSRCQPVGQFYKTFLSSSWGQS